MGLSITHADNDSIGVKKVFIIFSCSLILIIFLLNVSLRLFHDLGWISQRQWNNCGALQWRHNGRDSVSNHQPHDCLLNCLFRRWSKKTSKLRVTGIFAGNSPGTGEFPVQMASYAENVSIWWRHLGITTVILVNLSIPVRWTKSKPAKQHGIYPVAHVMLLEFFLTNCDRKRLFVTAFAIVIHFNSYICGILIRIW